MINIGNWDNFVSIFDGSNNDTVTLAQQTASVYSASAAGDNTVEIGDGTGNTINIDNNAPLDGNR